jgi:alpha-L-glutamate ligase-like protein
MSIKPSHILGMNGRHYYTSMNPYSAKRYGFSKLLTKELLQENNIPTAEIYHIFSSIEDIENVNWGAFPTPFVVKPASGSAGKGIILLMKKVENENIWKDNDGNNYTKEDLDLHVSNILDGEYSTWGQNHKALVEELIPPHPALAKYSYKGTPDLRVVIFNSIPVMAMIRIPTKKSMGKANLDQGAIGAGIDMATGITTYAISGKSEKITHFPGSKKKVNGILIPHWKKVLEVAVQASNAAGYKYMGADLFIHPDKGPMIVELNGYPGLSIQLANRAGLKRRLDRVEGLEVRDYKHGVKISQALFAESFADKIKIEEGLKIISTDPQLSVYGDDKRWYPTQGRVNTGRFRSAISEELADQLGLVDLEDLLWRQQEGLEGKLPVVEVQFSLKGKKHKTAMVVTKTLNKTKHHVELGRKDLEGYLVGNAPD